MGWGGVFEDVVAAHDSTYAEHMCGVGGWVGWGGDVVVARVQHTWNICVRWVGGVGCLETLWLHAFNTRGTYVCGVWGGWVGWGGVFEDVVVAYVQHTWNLCVGWVGGWVGWRRCGCTRSMHVEHMCAWGGGVGGVGCLKTLWLHALNTRGTCVWGG